MGLIGFPEMSVRREHFATLVGLELNLSSQVSWVMMPTDVRCDLYVIFTACIFIVYSHEVEHAGQMKNASGFFS
jgi:hypothetical protein